MEKPPPFQQPTPTLSPALRSLLQHPIFVEDSVAYSQFKPLRCLDP